MHEGRPYVELDRVAAVIETRPDATAGSIRAYPSFTRVVLETSGPVSYRVERGGEESRVRVSRLAGEPRAMEIRDGFVDTVRLERAGADVVVRVIFDGAAGELRARALADPDRLVLDFMRPAVPAEQEGRATTSP